jgi:hypothetical protein
MVDFLPIEVSGQIRPLNDTIRISPTQSQCRKSENFHQEFFHFDEDTIFCCKKSQNRQVKIILLSSVDFYYLIFLQIQYLSKSATFKLRHNPLPAFPLFYEILGMRVKLSVPSPVIGGSRHEIVDRR